MTEQFTDKKTVGIPPDIVQVRHDTELYKIQAENYAATAAERADAAGIGRAGSAGLGAGRPGLERGTFAGGSLRPR